MSLSINTNLMARNTARHLDNSYSRLSTSVRRLASGLRVNSAADDAAGLAIRELMRADVASLHQGMRNANDAISMIQTADGALAVIDEKLIRMKELAEQAATGTYDSTQRMMISSEYQAMAAEIDRIARATDFNGIKLLDGSLSGAHNGKGLASTGAMKIHFGSGNDSAEDYYYVEIGACTAAALGLDTASVVGNGTVIREKVEVVTKEKMTYTPQESYIVYTDPDTGHKYFTDGDYYFSSVGSNGSFLDWETDREIIERLETEQKTEKSTVGYAVYVDPVTNLEYFTKDGARTFNSDPYDPEGSLLDPGNPAHKAILDRLQVSRKTLDVYTIWRVYNDPAGKSFYTCDGGHSFVENYRYPSANILDSNNASDKSVIDTFKPSLVEKSNILMESFHFKEFYDPVTSRPYYQYENEKKELIYVSNHHMPYDTELDPVADKVLIDRLLPAVKKEYQSFKYETYFDSAAKRYLYSLDGGNTFIHNINDPLSFVNITSDKLDFVPEESTGNINCDVYEDTANGNKRYFSKDGGKTFFDDLGDFNGSVLDIHDPNYASIVANFKKIDSSVTIKPTFEAYHDSITDTLYYTCDGGKTFVKFIYTGGYDVVLDISNATDKSIIDRLTAVRKITSATIYFDVYKDPADNNKLYYTRTNGDHTIFVSDKKKPTDIALDYKNTPDQPVIDRLDPVQLEFSSSIKIPWPDIKYDIYVDNVTGKYYYSPDSGKSFTFNPDNPNVSGHYVTDKQILDRLQPVVKSKVSIRYVDRIIPGDSVAGAAISTQQAAQHALVGIDRAIVSKDKIRAHLGALQNRLENTVSNLSIQAENLQASESRISDTDVATEMTEFVRSQILSQTGVAMLAQANSLPRMLVSLIGG